jgi:hypothetical protein
MSPANTTLTERRTAPRRQPAVGTVCRLTASDGQSVGTALVWNISRSGVSMLLPTSLAAGTTLRADLRAASTPEELPVNLRVAHVRQLQTGDFVLGGQFERTLEPNELRLFLAF